MDESGLHLRIVLSIGQASDKAALAALLEGLPPARALIADRGYDAPGHCRTGPRARRRGRTSRPSETVEFQRSVDPALYRQRNAIERFFCKLKHFRRVATRFDQLARNFLAAVLLASTRLWLRAYESTT